MHAQNCVFDNDDYLNNYIDKYNRKNDRIMKVLEFYKQELGKYPDLPFLKGEIERYTQWLYKGSEINKKLTELKYAVNNIIPIGIDLYLESQVN